MGPKTAFVCSACQASAPRWAGQCTDCGAWNTLEEAMVSQSKKQMAPQHVKHLRPLCDVEVTPDLRFSSGLSEFDRVLGGGLVQGGVLLLGGEPGIGKSTLSLQLSLALATDKPVLYVTAEESEKQLFLRAQRLGVIPPSLYILSESNIHVILQALHTLQPKILILDSIQVVMDPEVPSVAGSVNQVRHCASVLIQALKHMGASGVFIGHITKEGQLAGPKVLEHLVDVILYLEGERQQQYRILRCFKNRFHHTQDIGVFEMCEKGLTGIKNPSAIFMDETSMGVPGAVIVATREGSRIFLIEVQALVVDSGYGMAKRTFLGVDPNRANLMIAAMEKIAGVRLSTKDVILNIVGGFRASEPAVDLGIVYAILSSTYDIALPKGFAVYGEVGLTGEVRGAPQAGLRIQELMKMGFAGCILPQKDEDGLPENPTFKQWSVGSLKDAITLFSKFK